MTAVFVLFGYCLMAQQPPPPPINPSNNGNGPVGGGAPIDGGLGILLGLGAAYSGVKIYKSSRKREKGLSTTIDDTD